MHTLAPMPIRRCFTLLELLVVIATIAILVALLRPSLNKGREMARTSVCISTEKQLASTTKTKDGSTADWAAWDLVNYKYVAVELPRMTDAGALMPFGCLDMAHAGLTYDERLNLVLLNDIRQHAVWVMRFDRKTAKMADFVHFE